MSIKTLLRDEIQDEVGELSKLELGSDKYKITVDGISKLADKVIEMDKLEIESEERIKDRKIETEIKFAEIEEKKKDRFSNTRIAIGSIVVSTIVTAIGAYATFKFEETGTVGSQMGRKFLNRILPNK